MENRAACFIEGSLFFPAREGVKQMKCCVVLCCVMLSCVVLNCVVLLCCFYEVLCCVVLCKWVGLPVILGLISVQLELELELQLGLSFGGGKEKKNAKNAKKNNSRF